MESIIKSENLAEVEVSYKSKVQPADRIQIKTSADSANALRSVWNENKIEHVEEMALLILNQANQVLGWVKLATGGLSMVVCDAKVIFQVALAANASAIILCHNHPSGSLHPSREDIGLTKKIVSGGEILGIKVLDHIILTANSYYSFSDEGII